MGIKNIKYTGPKVVVEPRDLMQWGLAKQDPVLQGSDMDGEWHMWSHPAMTNTHLARGYSLHWTVCTSLHRCGKSY